MSGPYREPGEPAEMSNYDMEQFVIKWLDKGKSKDSLRVPERTITYSLHDEGDDVSSKDVIYKTVYRAVVDVKGVTESARGGSAAEAGYKAICKLQKRFE